MEQVKTTPLAQLDEIEHTIYQAFDVTMKEYFEVMRDFNQKNRENKYTLNWITNTIKEKLGDLGLKQGYHIPKKEFLCDFTWLKWNKNLEELVFAMESEISDRSQAGILEDFNKLLVTNATYRVFFCLEYHNQQIKQYPESVNKVIDDLEIAFNTYKNLYAGSRLLILVCSDYYSGKVYPYLLIKK